MCKCVVVQGILFLGSKLPGAFQARIYKANEGCCFFPFCHRKFSQKQARGTSNCLAAEKMFSESLHHPFPPSYLPTLSLNPDGSLLLGWDLECGTTKFCSLGHTVFPTLQEVSLITAKVEQKYLCKTPWILSPSSFCFILFLVIIKQSIFYFHFLL